MTVRSSPAFAPVSCSSKPGTSRPEPSSIIWSRPSPPANGLAAERAHVVHDDEVALARGALDGLEPAGALAQPLDLGVDGLVGGGRVALGDLEALVVAERRGRADADLDREGQRLPRGGELAEVELRLAHRDDRRRVDGGGVPAADRVAHRLVEHGLAADALDHDGRGRLPGAEAGDADRAGERAGGLLDALLDLGGGHLGLDADARLGQLGDGCGDRWGGHVRRDTIPSRPCRAASPPGS